MIENIVKIALTVFCQCTKKSLQVQAEIRKLISITIATAQKRQKRKIPPRVEPNVPAMSSLLLIALQLQGGGWAGATPPHAPNSHSSWAHDP